MSKVQKVKEKLLNLTPYTLHLIPCLKYAGFKIEAPAA